MLLVNFWMSLWLWKTSDANQPVQTLLHRSAWTICYQFIQYIRFKMYVIYQQEFKEVILHILLVFINPVLSDSNSIMQLFKILHLVLWLCCCIIRDGREGFLRYGLGFCLLKNNEISDKHNIEKEQPQNKNNIVYQIDVENIAALPLTMNLIIYVHSSPRLYMVFQLSVWPATTLLFWFVADVIFSYSRQFSWTNSSKNPLHITCSAPNRHS